MRSPAAIQLTALCLIATGCVTPGKYEDMRHRAESAEAELFRAQMFIAGAHDDNAMLQKYGLELEQELMRWQYGSLVQAKREADLRKSCDI